MDMTQSSCVLAAPPGLEGLRPRPHVDLEQQSRLQQELQQQRLLMHHQQQLLYKKQQLMQQMHQRQLQRVAQLQGMQRFQPLPQQPAPQQHPHTAMQARLVAQREQEQSYLQEHAQQHLQRQPLQPFPVSQWARQQEVGHIAEQSWEQHGARSRMETAELLLALTAAMHAAAPAAPTPEVHPTLTDERARLDAAAVEGANAYTGVPQRGGRLAQHRKPASCTKHSSAFLSGGTASTCENDTADDLVEFASEPNVDAPQALEKECTLMVRNLPAEFDHDMLLEAWPADGSFDFLYVPWNGAGKCNFGFAFVNFVSESLAMDFKDKWDGCSMSGAPAGKKLSIGRADVEGFEANMLQLKKKRAFRIKLREHRPVIIRNGRRMDMSEFRSA